MNKNKTHILLAEDDKNLGYILCEYLKMHDYEVTLAKDGVEALQYFNKSVYSICIIDIMMPKLDGYGVARGIREKDSFIPIIFLTAKTLKVDKLKAFNLGADDYMTKPVDEEELIARIEAILRRSQSLTQENDKPKLFKIGETVFDYKNQKLTFNKKSTDLTTKESEILRELCLHPGTIVPRQDILKKYWGQNDYFSRKSMDVFIYKIRKHLAPDKTLSIDNVHGKGFVLKSTN